MGHSAWETEVLYNTSWMREWFCNLCNSWPYALSTYNCHRATSRMNYQILPSSGTRSIDDIIPELSITPSFCLSLHSTSPSQWHTPMYIPLQPTTPQAPGPSANFYFSPLVHSAPTPSSPSLSHHHCESPATLSFLSPSTKMLSIYFSMEEN